MADPRRGMRRQLERVPFVVAPAAEIDRVARAAGLVKTNDRREEGQALVGLRREQLDVADVRDISEARKRRAGHFNVVLLRDYRSEARTSVTSSSTASGRASRPSASATAIATSRFRRFGSSPNGRRRRIDRGAGRLPAFPKEAEQLAHRRLVVSERLTDHHDMVEGARGMPLAPGAKRHLRIGDHRRESWAGRNGIDDGGVDDAVAQHRHQVVSGAGAAHGRGIRHIGHVPFLQRDPFDAVEPDAALIGEQGPDPHRRGRRVGAHADATAVQVRRRHRAALEVANQVRQRIPAEDDDRQQPQRDPSRACHQERHQRQFGDVELEVPDDALEGLVGNGDVGEGQGTSGDAILRSAARASSDGRRAASARAEAQRQPAAVARFPPPPAESWSRSASYIADLNNRAIAPVLLLVCSEP